MDFTDFPTDLPDFSRQCIPHIFRIVGNLLPRYWGFKDSAPSSDAWPAMCTEYNNLAASKLTINLILKINTQNTVNRAYIWLKLVSVVIDNICTVRILYRDLSDSPFSGTI
jgi:hypothetical protein